MNNNLEKKYLGKTVEITLAGAMMSTMMDIQEGMEATVSEVKYKDEYVEIYLDFDDGYDGIMYRVLHLYYAAGEPEQRIRDYLILDAFEDWWGSEYERNFPPYMVMLEKAFKEVALKAWKRGEKICKERSSENTNSK